MCSSQVVAEKAKKINLTSADILCYSQFSLIREEKKEEKNFNLDYLETARSASERAKYLLAGSRRNNINWHLVTRSKPCIFHRFQCYSLPIILIILHY